MLFEESLGKKVINVFQDFLASGLTSGSEGEMNFIGCCNSEQILLFKKKKFLIQDFEDCFFFFLENHFQIFLFLENH